MPKPERIIPLADEGVRTGLLLLASQSVQARLGISGGAGISRREGCPLRLVEALDRWVRVHGLSLHPVPQVFDDPDLLVRAGLDNVLFHGEDEPQDPRTQWLVVALKGRQEPSDACREALMRIQRPEYAERRVRVPGPDGVRPGPPQVRRILFTEGVQPEPGTTIFLMSEVRVTLGAFTGERVEGALAELPGLFKNSTTESVHTDGRQPGPAPGR